MHQSMSTTAFTLTCLPPRKLQKLATLETRERNNKEIGIQLYSALASGQRFAAMWRKLTAKHVNHALDKPTLDMIEDGLRQVSQTGFPHNALESKIWEAELRAFTAPPHDVPDEVIQSNQLWKLRNGKAMGEDGWCEEWLRLLRGLCDESRVDLDNLLRLIGKFAVLPRHHREVL